MPGGLALPDDSNDLYSSQRAVLSIQDIYIKEEQADRSVDRLMLNEFEELSDPNSTYNLSGEDIISADNICVSPIDPEQALISDFNKMPVELALPLKAENVKMERSHFVKYVVRDGKHIKVWECGICAKEFGHQYTLMRHLPTHTDERKFQCNTCGKAFRQMSTLSQHRAIHSAERPYVCEICRKTFNRVSTLISHRKTHTGHKPHRCHLCNKAFHQKGNLRNHIFTHTNERPYKCDVCGKGFNQMSNLMCHKLKAHQRADKPRYSCQVCGKDFPKRMALRNHEQYQHGVTDPTLRLPEPPALEHCPTLAQNASANNSARVRYTNGVLVEPINTDAMRMALKTNQTPFALLRPLNGIPVLVRVLAAGDKQMLVPATAEDLRRHGQITITSTNPGDGSGDSASSSTPGPSTSSTGANSANGSTVQIKIPVVATVVQRCSTDGTMCMAVQSPGPREANMDGYVIATADSTEQDHDSQFMDERQIVGDTILQEDDPMLLQDNSMQEIQYLDEAGNVITEEEYHAKTQMLEFSTHEYTLMPEESYVGQTIDLDETMGPIAPNNNVTLAQNVEDVTLDQDNMQLTQLDTGEVYGVQSALDAIDKIIEEQKPHESNFGNGIMLDENEQGDPITMYSDATSILYGNDGHYMLPETQSCFD